MKQTLVIVLVDKRDQNAPKLQEILTQHGDCIRARLGLHDTCCCEGEASTGGLIVLQMCCAECGAKLETDLNQLPRVKAETVTVSLD